MNFFDPQQFAQKCCDAVLNLYIVQDIMNLHNILPNILNISYSISILLFVLGIFFEMYTLVILNIGNYINVITRFVCVGIALTCYTQFIDTSVGMVNDIVNQSIKAEAVNGMAKALQQAEGAINQNESDEETMWEKTCDFFKNPFEGIGKAIDIVSNSISSVVIFFLNLVFTIVYMGLIGLLVTVRNIYFIIIVILGPIAISLATMKQLSSYTWAWLRNFLFIVCWSIAAGLIMVIQGVTISNLAEVTGTSQSWVNLSVFVLYSIVFAIVLISSFWIFPSVFNGLAGPGHTVSQVISVFQSLMRTGSQLNRNNYGINGNKTGSNNQGNSGSGGGGGSGSKNRVSSGSAGTSTNTANSQNIQNSNRGSSGNAGTSVNKGSSNNNKGNSGKP